MLEKDDFLHQKNVPAVWFYNGSFLETSPNRSLKLAKKGFLIGNHG